MAQGHRQQSDEGRGEGATGWVEWAKGENGHL